MEKKIHLDKCIVLTYSDTMLAETFDYKKIFIEIKAIII